MQDDTTTPDSSQEATAENPIDDSAQLERDETQSPKGEETQGAVETSEDTSQTSETADTGPDEAKTSKDNSGDEAEIRDWAAKKNLPLDDPLKIAKMYRESESLLGKKGSEEEKLKSAVSTANSEAGIDDVQALRNEVQALSFYMAHPDAPAYDTQMASILEARPWLAGDLEAVFLMAKGQSSPTAETVAVAERQAGKKEALASVAQAERAAPPRASATTRESSRGLSDADVANMTPAEYAQAKADGKLDPWPKL